jgi:hypothetical protein
VPHIVHRDGKGKHEDAVHCVVGSDINVSIDRPLEEAVVCGLRRTKEAAAGRIFTKRGTDKKADELQEQWKDTKATRRPLKASGRASARLAKIDRESPRKRQPGAVSETLCPAPISFNNNPINRKDDMQYDVDAVERNSKESTRYC